MDISEFDNEFDNDIINDKNNEEKRYRCRGTNCNKLFKSLSSRSNHMKKCTEAQKTSPKKKAKQKGDKLYCRFCQKSYLSKSAIYKHQKNYCSAARLLQGKQPIPKKLKKLQEYPCSQCQRVFDRKGKLNMHIKNKHTDALDHYCNQCGKKFKRIDFFQKHVEKCEVSNNAASDDDPDPDLDISLGELPTFINENDLGNSSSMNGPTDYYDLDSFTSNSNISFEVPQNLLHESSMIRQCDSLVNEVEDVVVYTYNTMTDTYGNVYDACSIDENHVVETEKLVDINHVDENGSSNVVLLSSSPTSRVTDMGEESGNGLQDMSESIVKSQTYEDQLVKGLIQFLSRSKADTDFLLSSLYGIFGMKLHDKDLRSWIRRKLGMRKDRFEKDFNQWMSPSTTNSINSKGRGRKPLPVEFRQGIFDLWLKYSVISVDRRDGRDTVRIPSDAYFQKFHGIETNLVTFIQNKRKMDMAQAPRYMCTTTVRKMVSHVTQYLKAASLGIVASLRPFFVSFPCDREKLECLCITCFNVRQFFYALMRYAKKQGFHIYTSITSYFTQNKHCRDHKNGYHSRDCITGKCALCKGIIKPHIYPINDDADTADKVTFYQFEPKLTGKIDKKGKPKKKTARKDYNAVSIKFCKEKLDDLGQKYMLHRYNVVHEKFMWPLIQHQCNVIGDLIAHMDFSENIKEKPKLEVQPHHFSGEQHTLHCTVIETPEKNRYFYHFSDEKMHDWRFLKSMIKDLLQEAISDQQIIRTKSDNCSLQYKCGAVYAMLRELAMELLKTIIAYFGAAGHGRCLVDGMSSFGVKNPLRKSIIAEDFYWATAAELVAFFHKNGMHSQNRVYKELTKEEIASHSTVTPRSIKGCRKQHMIVFKPDGRILIKEDMCDCTKCLKGDVNLCVYDDTGHLGEEGVDEEDEEEEEEEEEDEEEEEEQDDVQASMIFEMVKPGQVIALRPDLEIRDNYFLAMVEAVKKAESDMFDMHNHFIRKGHKYLSCHYLTAKKEYKSYFQFVKQTSKVLVYPAEILSPFVEISDDLKLDMDEHQWLQSIKQ